MTKMFVRLLPVLGGLFLTAMSARANVIVTLEAFGQDGQPIAGAVAPGTNAVVDILLSADGADAPLADVRLIQFDFDATSAGIQLDSFTWSVDANGYSFQDPELPVTNVTSILLGSNSLLLNLTTEPVKVGSVDITINAAGTLDAVNPANTDDNYGADVRAGFTMTARFNLMAGNMQGGTLEFSVTGNDGGSGGGGGGSGGGGSGGGGTGGNPTPTDQDGDSVIDTNDAFPTDPNETVDTNNDGVGNNADPDDDSDGVVDNQDAFPVDPAEATDTNGDGIGNNADPDDDGDGIPDTTDAAPLDPNDGNDNTSDGGTTAPQPRACGAGMLGSSLVVLMGLGFMANGSRRRY